MNQIADALSRFNPTYLKGMDEIKLLRRYDTKFVFCREKLPAVFDFLSGFYNVLEIDNKRIFQYESMYYDTDDYYFYRQHHNKKYNRYKIRCRKYVDSNQCYFEIKQKNNKRKTIKSRLLINADHFFTELSDESKSFAKESVSLSNVNIIDQIKPKLGVDFDRITFANHYQKERFTIDLNLSFTNRNSLQKVMEDVVVAELKSEEHSVNSQLIKYLKELKIYPVTFSKYCIGVAMTERNIKHNRFKKSLLKLKKIVPPSFAYPGICENYVTAQAVGN